MNLVSDIAEMASKGWTAAKMAVELELKHGVQVSEAWLEHIMGADGFHAALAQARAKLASVVDAVEGKVEAVAAEPDKLVEGIVAKEDAVISSATSAANVGVPVPAPAAPETKAADEPKSE